MKKIALIFILILTVTGMAFLVTACSSATAQGQLAKIWIDGVESYTYNVTDTSTDETGTYKVDITMYTKDSDVENFGDKTLTDVPQGYLVKSVLDLGNTKYETGSYFVSIGSSQFLNPHSTYRIESIDGEVVSKMNGTYTNTHLDYNLSIDGENKNGSLAIAYPLFDNNQLHQAFRGLTTMSENFSFAFNTPIVRNEIGIANLNIRCATLETIKTPYTESVEKYEDGVSCYKVIMGRSTEVLGASHTLYYAKSDITVNGWGLKRVLVKFIEPTKGGNIIFELDSIAIA